MEYIIIAAFAAAAYLIYRSRKAKKGGSFRDHSDNGQER